MPRHVDWDVLIHLDQVSFSEIGQKDDYFKAVQDRYVTSYLDELGVEPLAHHKCLVARNAPLAECDIEATWLDTSAVANKLRISQPQITAGHKKKQVQDLSDAERSAEWFGHAKFIDVNPPPVNLDGAVQLDLDGQGRALREAEHRSMRAHAYASMKLHDLESSEKVDMNLTAELEQVRNRVREDLEEETGKADVFGRLLKKKGKREADEKELAQLKQKFLLPFAAERPGKAGVVAGTVLVPWQSPDLKTNPHIDVHDDFKKDALKPISLTIHQIEEEAFRYAVTGFPVELLTTRADDELFAAIREQLVTEESVRLIGLLAHNLYWIVLSHIHEPSQRLPEPSKQSLVLTIQELWSMMQAPARQRLGRRGELLSKDGPAGISFVIPAFMLAIKRGVEWCFLQQHPWIFIEQITKIQFLDQLNVMFMHLFDPDCLYASFGALEASEHAIKLWHKLEVLHASLGITPAARIINQEYRTTPLMSLLMCSDGGNPCDPKTRVLLAKSSSEGMLGSHSKPDHFKAPNRVPLEGWRRAALYRSANKRLNGLQRAGLEAATSKSTTALEKPRHQFMKSGGRLPIPGRSKHARSSERTSTVGSESTTSLRF